MCGATVGEVERVPAEQVSFAEDPNGGGGVLNGREGQVAVWRATLSA